MDLVLNEVYGYLIDKYGDNVDVLRIPSNKETQVTILYPEIEIKNSNRQAHKILNLYVRFTLRYSDTSIWIDSRIQGSRGTLTFAEYNSKYVHSHLKKETVCLDNFCLGSTGGLPSVISYLATTGLNIENFEMFLFQLKAFISWESLEGVPYSYLNKISNYSAPGYVSVGSGDIRNYLRANSSFPIKWVNVNGLKYIKRVDEEHPDYIAGLLEIIRIKGFMLNGIFVTALNNTEAVIRVNATNAQRKVVLIFKDNPVIQEILMPVEEDNAVVEYIPEPTIKEYITNILNKKLNEE